MAAARALERLAAAACEEIENNNINDNINININIINNKKDLAADITRSILPSANASISTAAVIAADRYSVEDPRLP